jgi:hypothetical protein
MLEYCPELWRSEMTASNELAAEFSAYDRSVEQKDISTSDVIEDWDRQIEEDILAGRLDQLANAAIAEHRAGNSRPFPIHE